MPNDFIPLPADPCDLTRELALQCFDHPHVLVDAAARAAYKQAVIQQSSNVQHSCNGTPAPGVYNELEANSA